MRKSIIFIAIFMFLLMAKSYAKFNDVSETEWYYSAVKYVSENNILNGTGDDNFSPLDSLTRAMIAQVIYNMEETPEVNEENLYTDVIEGKWYEDAVIWASSNKIVSGMGDDKFAPNELITKEQMITILYNYAKYKEYDVSVGEDTNILSYDDAFELSEYAYTPMQWACGASIIKGYNGNLNSKNPLTRAEVSTIIKNFKYYYPDDNTIWIDIEGNPTTGYIWSADGYDEDVIKVFDYEYISEDLNGVVGQGGKFRFEVKVLNEGNTRIIFKYGRSWENNAIKTIICNIKVDENMNIELSYQGEEEIKMFLIRTTQSNFLEYDSRIIKDSSELELYKSELNLSDSVFNSIITSLSDYNNEYFKKNYIGVIALMDNGVKYEVVSIDRILDNTLSVTLNKKNRDVTYDEMWYIFLELPVTEYSDINNVVILK